MALRQNILDYLKKVRILRVPRWYDLPFMWEYVSYFENTNKDVTGTGSSLISSEIAITKSFYELIERFSLSYLANNSLRLNFIGEHKKAIIPYNILFKNIDENIINNPRLKNIIAFPKDKITFIWGHDLLNKNKILIPVQLIYIHRQKETEKFIRESNSNGAAAGINLKHSLVNGILEVLERDAFINYYLNEFWGEKLNLAKLPKIKNIVKKIKKYNLEIYSFHLPSDIKVFNIVTFVIDKSGLAPIINCGSSSGFDIEDCVLKSVEESLQVLSWGRHIFLKNKKEERIDLDTLEGRALFWADIKKLKLVYKWIQKSRQPREVVSLIEKFKKLRLNNISRQLNYLISEIKKQGYYIYYVDITHRKLKPLKVKVIKVIIPQLQWIYLGESYKYIDFDRIKKIREINNLKPYNVPIESLNKVPHFFL